MKRDSDEIPSAPPSSLSLGDYAQVDDGALPTPVPRGKGAEPSAPLALAPGMTTVRVEVPRGVVPGQEFPTVINGNLAYVVCPEHLCHGRVMTLQVPASAATSNHCWREMLYSDSNEIVYYNTKTGELTADRPSTLNPGWLPPRQSAAIPLAFTFADDIPVAVLSTGAAANVPPLMSSVSANAATNALNHVVARAERRDSDPSYPSSLLVNPMRESTPAQKPNRWEEECLRDDGVRKGYCNAHALSRPSSSQKETPIALTVAAPPIADSPVAYSPSTFCITAPNENAEKDNINPNVLSKMRLVGVGAAAILAFGGGPIVLDIKRFGDYFGMGIIGYFQLGALSPERTAENGWRGGSWTDVLEAITLIFVVACIIWNVVRPKQGGRGVSIASSLLCFSHVWPKLGELLANDNGNFIYALPLIFTLIGSFNIDMFRKLSKQEKKQVTFNSSVYNQISISLGAMTLSNGMTAVLTKRGFTIDYDVPFCRTDTFGFLLGYLNPDTAWFGLFIAGNILGGFAAVISGAFRGIADGRSGIALVLIAIFWGQVCIAFSYRSYRGCLFLTALLGALWVYFKPGSIKGWLMTSMFYLLSSVVLDTDRIYDESEGNNLSTAAFVAWCVLWLFRMTFLASPNPTLEHYAYWAQSSMMLYFLGSLPILVRMPHSLPVYHLIQGCVNATIGVLFVVSLLDGWRRW